MNKADLYDLVRVPVLTEKSTAMNEQNKYVFRVSLDATKSQVKKAIEYIFNVQVLKVNTLRVEGKTKRFRGRLGKRVDYKKAIVQLSEGQTINFLGA
jgi:large subunit ribosomal protein L23